MYSVCWHRVACIALTHGALRVIADALLLSSALLQLTRHDYYRCYYGYCCHNSDLPQRDAQLFNMWAMLEQRNGNLDSALSIVKTGRTRFPAEQSLLQTEGTIEERRGNFATAAELYCASTKIRPTAPAYVAWALLEDKLAAEHDPDDLDDDVIEHVIDNVIEAAGDIVVTDTSSSTSSTATAAVANSRADSSSDTAAAAAVATAATEAAAAVQHAVSDDTATSTITAADTAAADATADADADSSSSTSEQLLNDGRNEARRLFELGIRADPKHGPLYNAYGSMEARLGNVERARAVFKRGITARCTDMASVWHGLGSVELRQGDSAAARRLFLRGMAEAGRAEDVSFLSHSLGALELHAHNATAARAAFAAGLLRCPNNSPLLLGAALAEVKLGCLAEARAFFRQAVRADKAHAHAWQAWGVLEAREGNVETSRSLFEGGLRAVPTHSALWQAYGLMEIAAGHVERARNLFKAGIDRCRGHTSVVRLQQAWAVLDMRSGDIDAARQLIGEALAEEPHHGACWTVYAAIEEKAEDVSKARKVCYCVNSNSIAYARSGLVS
jgi:tetratricopeptide (TPR) repeat protein